MVVQYTIKTTVDAVVDVVHLVAGGFIVADDVANGMDVTGEGVGGTHVEATGFGDDAHGRRREVGVESRIYDFGDLEKMN